MLTNVLHARHARQVSAGEQALGDVDQRLAHAAVGAPGERAVLAAHRVDEDGEADQRAGGQRLGGVPADRRTAVVGVGRCGR